MSVSTKLSTSVKALCYLAQSDKPKNSAEIAKQIGANASKLRMLLSKLGKSGIVKSDSGMRGGFSMNKNRKTFIYKKFIVQSKIGKHFI